MNFACAAETISSYELKLHTPNEVGAALVIDKIAYCLIWVPVK